MRLLFYGADCAQLKTLSSWKKSHDTRDILRENQKSVRRCEFFVGREHVTWGRWFSEYPVCERVETRALLYTHKVIARCLFIARKPHHVSPK